MGSILARGVAATSGFLLNRASLCDEADRLSIPGVSRQMGPAGLGIRGLAKRYLLCLAFCYRRSTPMMPLSPLTSPGAVL
jgi:hypothetical protein